MTAVAILAEPTPDNGTAFRAVAGDRSSVGAAAGQALDALAAQSATTERGTLAIIQHRQPDRCFSADQQRRLGELMQRWRNSRDTGTALPAEEQGELDALVEAEWQAATRRAADLIQQLAP